MSELILEKLRELAGMITVLRGRVREAVAGEVGKAVSNAVSEVVTVALGGGLVRFARYPGHTSSYGRSDWDEAEHRGWEARNGVDRRYHDDDDERVDTESTAPSPEAVLALAMTAGRWWLRRQGSTWGAAGIGLVAGAALLGGGPVARTTVGVLWALQRLLSATDALSDGARELDRP